MALKQISLTLPEKLLEASKEHSEEFGYKNVQEFILDLVRDKVIMEKVERYSSIEKRMKGKAKKMTQDEAMKYIKGL
jgi:metal-responsive CopG/Arc/MetJ family transcriptional regulator